jgi:hypothetical protein
MARFESDDFIVNSIAKNQFGTEEDIYIVVFELQDTELRRKREHSFSCVVFQSTALLFVAVKFQ